MSKTSLTKQLETAIWKATRKQGTFGCHEVTIGFFGNERVDYMTYDTSGTFRCFEIKVSASDFRSNNKNSFVGHLNYYVMPIELYEKVKTEIPSHVGVYASWTGNDLSCVKKPKRQELVLNPDIMKDSMLRSLYREYEKLNMSEDKGIMERLKTEINRLKKQVQEDAVYSRELSILKYKIRRKYGSEALFELESMSL